MQLKIRPARADEMADYGAITAYVYAGRYGDSEDNLAARSTHPDWTLCAFVDGRMVTTFATIPFTARFNGRAVKLGGVSGVGTLPEYRRLGFMRRIMQQAIADMRDRGQFVAALWASQAAIYQRFSFAQASQMLRYTVDPREIRFSQQRQIAGTCQRHDLEDGFSCMRQLYIDFIGPRTGYLHRARPLWDNNVLEHRLDEGPLNLAIAYDAQQCPQGYLVYTVQSGRVDNLARSQELIVRDLVWLTPNAYLHLWEFIAKHDLVGRVRYHTAPLDDPAAEWFEEPRLLHTQLVEGTWMRIIDVIGALQARGYTTDGHLVLEVMGDEMADWNNGVFHLQTDGDTTRVTRTHALPDIRLSIKALASLSSGFRSAQRLATWGLLDGEQDGIEAADRLFRTRYRPHCPDHF